MAAQSKHTPQAPYRTQGGAAYDIYARQPVRLPDELPQEEAKPQRPVRVRAQMQISLFSVIGLAVTAFLGVLVIFGYVRLYETNAKISALERELTLVQEEGAKLESTYETRFDLVEVEQQALAHGMSQPRAAQKIYLHLGTSDHAQITPAGKENLLSRVFEALRGSVLGFVEYLS